jgi:hypothetical protein
MLQASACYILLRPIRRMADTVEVPNYEISRTDFLFYFFLSAHLFPEGMRVNYLYGKIDQAGLQGPEQVNGR